MSSRRFFAVMFTFYLVMSLGPSRLAAQTSTTGDVAGVVTDPSGANVPDATVSLKDETKGNTQETNTNKDGVYHFSLLTPGPYTITVKAAGFETVIRHADVAIGQIATLNARLAIGASSATVTVTEAVPLLQTENGDTSTSLTEQQLSQVPNPGNDLTYTALLAPGTVMNTQGGGAGGNVEAFGLPGTSNLFTVNGMDDNDAFLNVANSGASNLLLGTNEMQEVDVVTNGYSGAYGTLAGVNVNYVTKSGGNDFHGNLVYYWTGRAMDATNWITHANGEAKPFNNANQWAASLGGPIKKDKLFFFLNTEGLRVLIPVPQFVTVPTTAFEAATITNLTSLGLTDSIPFYCQNIAAICPGVGAVPGSGNGIFNLYNGVKNLANATPTPQGGCGGAQAGVGNPILLTQCTNQIQETPINFAPEWQLTGRVDWNIGVNDRAFMHVVYDQGFQPSITDPVNPIFNTVSIQPQWYGQLVETHTFSPTLVNQFIMTAQHYTAIFAPSSLAATLAAFPANLNFGFSDGSLSAVGGAAGFAFPQGRNVSQIQFGDDVTKTVGNHGVKFGFKLHRDYVSDHDGGVLTQFPLLIPISLTDFYNGGSGAELIKNFAASTNVPIRINNIAGYIQDDWRVNSNFTISPALRLEHNSNPQCADNCYSTFAGGLSQAIANVGAPYNSLIQTGRSSALYSYQTLQWEPRVSFAWQPFGSTASGILKSNLVVRGGVGIFYDTFPGVIADSMSQNPPQYNGFTIAGAAVGGTCAGGYLSPNQPGNLIDCASAANTAFISAFNSGANSVAAVPNIATATRNNSAPQYQKWSLEIQKSFGANDSFDIGYYGNHGIHETVQNNSLNGFGYGSLPATQPQPQFGEITQVENAAVSNYNGLVASYKHRFNSLGGGLIQFNYTYSHALDEISNGGFSTFALTGDFLAPQNPFNLRDNYGPADYDVRHSFNANYVWQVPIRRALGGHGTPLLVDGWQVSGTIFARTGLPYSVTDSTLTAQLNGQGYFGPIFPNVVNPAISTACSNVRSSVPTGANGGVTKNCLNSADFVAAGSETGPTPGLRNLFRGPVYFNTDFTVMKNTNIPHWERGKLGIGFQFFNLFNHPNFNFPVSDLANPAFGQTQSLVSPPTSILGSFLGGDASPRLIQLKAQLTF
jgi:Carboxypeptidase regulatory-like domain